MGTSALQEMKASVRSVERIIGYRFKNKRLLEEALTHPSFKNKRLSEEALTHPSFKNKRLSEEALTHSSPPSSGAEPVSYERLEFVGDAVIGLAISNYFFQTYPQLTPGELTIQRSANVSNDKLARVAVRHGLYQYVRHFIVDLDDKVSEFAEAVREEDDKVAVREDDKNVYGGSMKGPKILADIVESIAAAVYYDVNLDLQKLWVILKDLLEPIITIEDLEKRPIRNLYDVCQKQGKLFQIKLNTSTKTVASVYFDGRFVASASSDQKEIARLRAAKSALLKLPQSRPDDVKKWTCFEFFWKKGTEPTCFQFFLSVLLFWFLYTLVSKLL